MPLRKWCVRAEIFKLNVGRIEYVGTTARLRGSARLRPTAQPHCFEGLAKAMQVYSF